MASRRIASIAVVLSSRAASTSSATSSAGRNSSVRAKRPILPALDVAELVLAARDQSTTAIEAMRREALPAVPAPRERRPSAFPRQRVRR